MAKKAIVNLTIENPKDKFLALNDEQKGNEFCKLLDENRKLKIQIHTYENSDDLALMYMWCDLKAKDKIKELKKQQKEFIKYLKDEVDKIRKLIRNYDIWHEVRTDINFLILKKQIYIEILQKYEEIVGVSNETN